MTAVALRPASSPVTEVPARYHAVLLLEDLVAGVQASLTNADPLNAFLYAASICQVASDHIHRDVRDLRRAASLATRLPAPVGPLARGAGGMAATAATQATAWRERGADRWLAAVESFTTVVAGALWDRTRAEGDAVSAWHHVGRVDQALPVNLIAIPPRCFATFDQRPEDAIELASRFDTARPDHDAGVLVVGIRTSGCFLAPIVAASLGRHGWRDPRWVTWRPGQPVLARDRAALDGAARAGAQVVIVDDPPTSGGSYARVARDLERLGIDRERITLLLPTFAEGGPWMSRLAPWRRVELPFREWDVQRQLKPEAVNRELTNLVTGGEVTARRGGDREYPLRVIGVAGARRLPASHRSIDRRGHVSATYRVRFLGYEGSSVERDVVVRGAGLGMFGANSGAIAAHLEGWIPDVYGIRDGLIYEDAGGAEPPAAELSAVARAAGGYAAHREASLPVAADFSRQMRGHDALWEQASRWLGAGFGRLAPVARPGLDRVMRSLLAAPRPCLVDADMRREQWVSTGSRILKRGWGDGAFTYQLPHTYDAAYDVAGAAADHLPDDGFGDVARAEFEGASGRHIDDFRWFLYRLVSLLDARDAVVRAGGPRAELVRWATEGERIVAALHRAFVCRALVGSHATGQAGELAAIDVDGVLESVHAWYPAPTPAAAGAIRALRGHGFRPVLATGRALAESIVRCRDYGLAGAVAEYGSVMYNATTSKSTMLVDPDTMLALEALRRALAQEAGIEIDRSFTFSVRAFVLRDGRRRALDLDTASRALDRAGATESLRIVEGWAQTDFVGRKVDKSHGLQRLSRELDANVAFACGDAAEDVGMLTLANLAAVPATAASGIDSAPGVQRTRGRYGRGLGEAVGRLIGHRPGACPMCARATIDRESRFLISMLDARDASGAGKLRAIATSLRGRLSSSW